MENLADMDERLEGMRFIIDSKLEDVIALTQIVATEVVREKPKNEYWHIYNYLEALLKAKQCKEAVEKKLQLESRDCGTQIETCQRDSCTSPNKPDHDDTLTEEEAAAIKIQRAYRACEGIRFWQKNEEGVLQSEGQDLSEKELAAIIIQKAYRAHRSKSMQDNDTWLLSSQQDLLEKDKAATKIQKAYQAKRSQSMQDVKKNNKIDPAIITEAKLLKQEEETAIKIEQAFQRWNRTSDQKESTLEIVEEEELEVSPSKLKTKKKSSNANLLKFISDFRGRRRSVADVEPRQMISPPATTTPVRRRQSWVEGSKGGEYVVKPMSPDKLKMSCFIMKAQMANLPKPPISPASSVKNIAAHDQPQTSERNKNVIQSPQDTDSKFLSPSSHISSLNSCLTVNQIHGFSVAKDEAHVKQKQMKEYSNTVDKLNLKEKIRKISPAPPPSSPRSTKDGKE